MNILCKNRKKKLFFPGGPLNTDWNVYEHTSLNVPNSLYDKNPYAKIGRNSDFSKNENAKYGMNSDYTFNENAKIGGVGTGGGSVTDLTGGEGKGFNLGNAMDKASAWGKVAEVGVQGAMTGAKNTNQGMYDTSIGVSKETSNDASNVSNAYTAGSQMKLMSKTGNFVNAKDLKTHKGWKNILGSTASGAMAGAAAGGGANPYTAAAGAVIGLVGSTVGEIFGNRKRKKQAEEMNRLKTDADYAVDYYNSKQAEQLQSANDNAAHSMANQNRYSVLGLMAKGGRRNCLINTKRL